MKHYLKVGLLFSTALVSAQAIADEFTADNKVDAATVYRSGGALVSRIAEFNIPQGKHTIVFPKLPEGITDDFSPFVNRLKGTAKITSVKFKEIYSSETISPEQQRIKKEIESVRANIIQAQQNIEAKQLQLNFLKSLNENHAPNGTSMSIEDWKSAIDFIGDTGGNLLSKIENYRNNINILNNKIKVLHRELNAVGKLQNDSINGIITIEANEIQTIALEINYFMENSDWNLVVDSSLSSEQETLEINNKASITQATGENWENISLTLANSTNRFNDFGSVEQNAEILSLRPPLQVMRAPDNYRLQKRGAPREDIQEIIVAGSQLINQQTFFNQSYSLRAPYTHISSADNEEIEISSTHAPTAIVLKALPREDETAYVFAETTLQSYDSQRSVTASLYRDGNYLGKNRWPDLISGKKLSLPFGADEQIEIQYQIQPPQDDKKGVFSKSNVEETRVIISVTNHHSSPQTIQIYDRIPVSGHKDIKVAPIKGATKPTQQNMENKQGLVMWQKTLKPNETWEIKHQYQISYPANQILNRQ